jgi:hypothetical protein
MAEEHSRVDSIAEEDSYILQNYTIEKKNQCLLVSPNNAISKAAVHIP